MNDAEREQRAVWKLEPAGYHVTRQDGRYVVIGPEHLDELQDLACRVEYAEAVYERV